MSENNINKQEILEAAKNWFRETIAKNHVKNTLKLSISDNFNINPFLATYLARFLCGDTSPKSIAKALVYPRVLGTSISTSFGQNTQKFTSEVLSSMGSAVSGIDIEFFDCLDGRKKYCQLKSGPNTINADDVETIHNHFSGIKNLARTNNLNIGINDLVVGVLYGDKNELSGHYRSIENTYHYPVYIGKDFWHRLTGQEDFYYELGKAISSVAEEYDGREILETAIDKLSKSGAIIQLSENKG